MKRLLIYIASFLIGFLLVVVFQPLPHKVTGESMEPAITSGDVVITAKGNYKVGDIIVFEWGDKRIIHRIYRVEGDTYRVWGDNNEMPDALHLRDSHIIGKMILRVGK
jgi:signal peptidase I